MMKVNRLNLSNGFPEVKVTSRVEDDYGGKVGAVAVFIEIQEGRQWLVSSVALEGVSPENDESVRAILQSGPGQPFSEANIALAWRIETPEDKDGHIVLGRCVKITDLQKEFA